MDGSRAEGFAALSPRCRNFRHRGSISGPMPLPQIFDPPSAAEIAHLPRPSRRPHLAALVPRVTLRFSYRGSNTVDDSLYDGSADSTRWFVPFGVTFEATASWTFDRLFEALPPVTDADDDGSDDENGALR